MTTERLKGQPEDTTLKEHCLSEIKTLLKVLNTWGNAFVPDLEGKSVRAQERLAYFVSMAQNEHGMTLEEIESAVAL